MKFVSEPKRYVVQTTTNCHHLQNDYLELGHAKYAEDTAT